MDKEQVKKLRSNYCNIVEMLDKMLLSDIKIQSNLIDQVAVVSSQSQKVIVKLLENKTRELEVIKK